VQRLKLPRSSEIVAMQSSLFDGIVQLSAEAEAIDEAEFKPLYRTVPPKTSTATMTALPYYLWANRGHGSMMVWIPEG
jgi:DUF1680 family protein